MHFNLWRSNDGENWINENPSIPDIPAYVSVTEAVEGPKGIVAVGWSLRWKMEASAHPFL